jgi:hypothetical protein
LATMTHLALRAFAALARSLDCGRKFGAALERIRALAGLDLEANKVSAMRSEVLEGPCWCAYENGALPLARECCDCLCRDCLSATRRSCEEGEP